ncbi:MAG TPA: hypothetical protein VNT77_07310 [Allosphingosinicella sp.]|nr:hypothetical protein [Allosphingosinicella sp.]
MRLPKEVAYGREIDVTISRTGDVITIVPKGKKSLKDMIGKLRSLPRPDYVEEREPFEAPDRPGL